MVFFLLNLGSCFLLKGVCIKFKGVYANVESNSMVIVNNSIVFEINHSYITTYNNHL